MLIIVNILRGCEKKKVGKKQWVGSSTSWPPGVPIDAEQLGMHLMGARSLAFVVGNGRTRHRKAIASSACVKEENNGSSHCAMLCFANNKPMRKVLQSPTFYWRGN